VNVILPDMQRSIGASNSAIQWVLSGYTLAFGVFLVAAGRAGDLFGRGRLFVIGVGVFALGSLIAGLSPDPLVLNIARISVGIGPVLGGGLIAVLGDEWGWRSAFLINVPIALAAIVLGKVWLPKSAWFGSGAEPDPRDRHRADFDPVGLVLLAFGTLLIMLPFLERSAGAWIYALVPAGAAIVFGWVKWENRYARRGGSPMVDMQMFRT